jgi:hypothetical protein
LTGTGIYFELPAYNEGQHWVPWPIDFWLHERPDFLQENLYVFYGSFFDAGIIPHALPITAFYFLI